MNKLTGQTPDLTKENIEKLALLFPHVVTEVKGGGDGEDGGAPARAIDFDLLRQALSGALADGADERYRLDWPGKRASLLKANTPITKTLRPVRAESVDFDTTQNLFIEGGNFEALKILQESYLGKVKMIYIDPPYNTGKDFVYSDNFTQDKAEYEEEIEAVDDEGNKMFRENTRTNPRFHSDWLSMMYERLIIARDLLRDDGVIFISIDDNEVHNLRKVCDEIFGESNFISSIIWQKKYRPQNDAKQFSIEHDYILCYAKQALDCGGWQRNLLPRSESALASYKNHDSDPRGPWQSSGLMIEGVTKNGVYEIKSPTDKVFKPDQGKRWSLSKDSFQKAINEGRVWFGKSGDASPRIKRYLSEVQAGVVPTSLWKHDEVGHTGSGSKDVGSLELKDFFSYPKPVSLIQKLIYLGSEKSDIIFDFFSGSATTAHAVMQQNAEDDGNRKFIMVQLDEATPSDSEASKAGYANIAQLGRERIRRAAAKIRTDFAESLAQRATPLDTGFRTYRVADSAFLDVERHPSELEQGQLLELANNIKPDRTPEDLLTQVMLELGLTLNLPIETKTVGSNTVFYVAHNALVACFDAGVPTTLIDEMAKLQPLQVAFRDSSFGSDDALINAETHLKRLSPDTILSVI